MDHQKTNRAPEKHVFLLYWLCQSLCVCHNKLWKILKEMEITDDLACLLRNLYAGQEATVRTGDGTTDWFQIEKWVFQGCILSPAYLTYMQSISWETPGFNNMWPMNFQMFKLVLESLANFKHCFTSMWDECNCAVVWAFLGIAFPWDWNENWPFPVLWPLLSFQICWHIECNTTNRTR